MAFYEALVQNVRMSVDINCRRNPSPQQCEGHAEDLLNRAGTDGTCVNPNSAKPTSIPS
jgi:hypothetical protein